MRATPKIHSDGTMMPPIPIAGDGGMFIQCQVYDPPGRRGETVDVFVPASMVDSLLRAARDQARDLRLRSGPQNDVESPLLDRANRSRPTATAPRPHPPQPRGPIIFDMTAANDAARAAREAADHVTGFGDLFSTAEREAAATLDEERSEKPDWGAQYDETKRKRENDSPD